MKKVLIALLLLSACKAGEDQPGGGGDAAGPAGQASRGGQSPAPGGRLTSLTGLYEGGEVDPKNQLCMVEAKGSDTQFGLVVWGGNMHSCSGSGTAERNGDVLRLKMTGDEACTIDARIAGTTITLPERIPDGCAYYCGARAQMNGVSFTQRGAGKEEAAKAKDLVGDPLC